MFFICTCIIVNYLNKKNGVNSYFVNLLCMLLFLVVFSFPDFFLEEKVNKPERCKVLERFLRILPFFLKKFVTPLVLSPGLHDMLEADILIHGMNEGPNGWDKMRHGCGGS